MQLTNQPQLASRAQARRFTPANSRSAALVVRAVHQPERTTRSPWQAAQGVVLSCAAAALLVMGAPQGSLLPAALAAEPVQTFAPADVESAYEQEVTVEEQKNMLGFLLQQQENAKKAAILSQRQQLQQEVGRVEAALQARLTQQKANVVGAKQAGDSKAIESATAAASELEEKQAQIIKAAAQLSAQLDRMELIERARSAAARQTIERAASQIDGAVNTRINPWLEAMGRAATK